MQDSLRYLVRLLLWIQTMTEKARFQVCSFGTVSKGAVHRRIHSFHRKMLTFSFFCYFRASTYSSLETRSTPRPGWSPMVRKAESKVR